MVQSHIFGHINGGIYGVAGHYSDNDDTQHVVVASPDGTLYEINWNPNHGPTTPTRVAHFDNLACLASFFTPDDNFQHAITATSDGDLYEVYWEDPHAPKGPKHLLTLDSVAGLHVGMVGFFTPDESFRNAVVVNDDGEIHQIYFDADNPPQEDTFSSSLNLDAIAGIAGFIDPTDNSCNIIVAAKHGPVFNIHFLPGQANETSSQLTDFHEPVANVSAFFSPETKIWHIIVLTQSGKLYDYTRTAQSELGKTLLTTMSNVVDIASYYSANDNFNHVILGTGDGNLHEVFYS